jgi:hypothetical protein
LARAIATSWFVVSAVPVRRAEAARTTEAAVAE